MFPVAAAELGKEDFSPDGFEVVYDEGPDVQDVAALDVVPHLQDGDLGPEKGSFNSHTEAARACPYYQHLLWDQNLNDTTNDLSISSIISLQ